MSNMKRLAQSIPLHIDYEDGDGNTSTRKIDIEAVGTSKNGVVFEAWCNLRNETRSFRIDRIMSVIDSDGVVHDPAPEIGRVLMAAHSAPRSALGRTKRQKEMDATNERNSKTAKEPSTMEVILMVAAAASPFFYVDGFWKALMVSVGMVIACGVAFVVLKK